MQWEGFNEKLPSTNSTTTSRSGIHSIENSIAVEAKIAAMMKIKKLSDDGVKLRFIPFSLRDNANKWSYSLAINSITIWAEFVVVFLKIIFPMHKTARIRSEINQFR